MFKSGQLFWKMQMKSLTLHSLSNNTIELLYKCIWSLFKCGKGLNWSRQLLDMVVEFWRLIVTPHLRMGKRNWHWCDRYAERINSQVLWCLGKCGDTCHHAKRNHFSAVILFYISRVASFVGSMDINFFIVPSILDDDSVSAPCSSTTSVTANIPMTPLIKQRSSVAPTLSLLPPSVPDDGFYGDPLLEFHFKNDKEMSSVLSSLPLRHEVATSLPQDQYEIDFVAYW